MGEKHNLINTLKIIQNDIEKNKVKTLILGVFSFLVSIGFIPLLLLIIVSLLEYSNLPIFGHWLLHKDWKTNLVFIALDIVLLFYILLIIKKPNNQNKEYKKNFKISVIFFFITSIISFLSIYTEINSFIIFVYIFFFLTTLYFISKTFFYKKYNQNIGYEDDYLGIYNGVIDDPFTIRDDINRAKLSLNGIFAGFSFLFFFFEQVLNSIVFFYSIHRTDKVIESAELFNYILEGDLESKILDKPFSIYAKNILESIEYVIFDDYIIFLKKGKERRLQINQR